MTDFKFEPYPVQAPCKKAARLFIVTLSPLRTAKEGDQKWRGTLNQKLCSYIKSQGADSIDIQVDRANHAVRIVPAKHSPCKLPTKSGGVLGLGQAMADAGMVPGQYVGEIIGTNAVTVHKPFGGSDAS